jgi:hypothetical protein
VLLLAGLVLLFKAVIHLKVPLWVVLWVVLVVV